MRGLLHLNVVSSRSLYNDRQKKKFNEIFEEGEGTGIKVNPDTVAKTMRRARNKNNERVSQQVASYFSRKEISQTQEVDFLPQAVCCTCVKYQLNLETKEHLLQMKIKDLQSIVRELVLGVKGRKKDDVIQGMPLIVSFKERSAVTRRSINTKLRRFVTLIPSLDN